MIPVALTSSDILTEAQAAELLHVAPGTLRVWRTNKRHVGKAPPYIQQGKGRVLYLRSDLAAWIEANRRVPTHRSKPE